MTLDFGVTLRVTPNNPGFTNSTLDFGVTLPKLFGTTLDLTNSTLDFGTTLNKSFGTTLDNLERPWI